MRFEGYGDNQRGDVRRAVCLAVFLLLTARAMVLGEFLTLWRLCIEFPSQPKLASSLPNKRLSYWRLTDSARNDRGGRNLRFEI